MPTADVVEPIEQLTACRQPFLIGVRHHSPALAVAMPALLAAADADVLLVELPTEAQPWLPWLVHPEAQAPLALALAPDEPSKVRGVPHPVAFYPFADFSPELVALRWAAIHGVPVVACDRPVACRVISDEAADRAADDAADQAKLAEQPVVERALAWNDLVTANGGHHEIWERLVETASAGATPEQLRRAALAVGWGYRAAEGSSDPENELREAWMRHHLTEARQAGHRRPVAVIGAFHAAALLTAQTEQPEPVPSVPITASLVPYSDAQLDARSGYPAGVRDPAWRYAMLQAGGDPDAIRSNASRLLTRVAAELRAAGHPAGPAEATEMCRLAVDLATLRGYRAPGRREVLEALTSVLAQGDVAGRGRAVAAAAERVLVGAGQGRLAPGSPRSALAVSLDRLLRRLGLPAALGDSRTLAGDRPRRGAEHEYRFEPLRSELDAERVATLHRMLAAQIVYAEPLRSGNVAELWHVQFSAGTAATIEAAAAGGPRLVDCARFALLRRRDAGDDDQPSPASVLAWLEQACCCALPDLVLDGLRRVGESHATIAGFAQVVAALDVVGRLRAGGFAGLSPCPADLDESAATVTDRLVGSAIRELDGVAGSSDPADATALVVLAETDRHTALRLADGLRRMARDGSTLMQGAALGTRLRLGLEDGNATASRVASWILGAHDSQSRTDLRQRLIGLLVTAGGLLEASEALLSNLAPAIEACSDAHFVSVLPALRGGFDALSPADRERLLRTLAATHQLSAEFVEADPAELARVAAADLAAKQRLEALGLADLTFSPAERWRLVLGRQREALSPDGFRLASSLDQLYGSGHGEGTDHDRAQRAGTAGTAFPGTRVWGEELEALFGHNLRDEVVAEAVERGHADAVELLEQSGGGHGVRPSVELLSTVLSLAGALPEARLARLRPLVARLVEELTRELATQLRPALAGLSLPGPTRRDTGLIDLARTVEANLHHALRGSDGQVQLVVETPVFRQRGAREADWHVIVVVDVSGSMEASTIFAAITSAILAGVRCLRVSFVTFSTEIIDLSETVDDPLSLLLEISVGGGTSIAHGLEYARTLVRVPGRTLVALITDFHEGGSIGPLLAQVTALAHDGVTMLGCAALDDTGTAAYHVGTAASVAAAGMPVAAVSPHQLARWVADVVNR